MQYGETDVILGLEETASLACSLYKTVTVLFQMPSPCTRSREKGMTNSSIFRLSS